MYRRRRSSGLSAAWRPAGPNRKLTSCTGRRCRMLPTFTLKVEPSRATALRLQEGATVDSDG